MPYIKEEDRKKLVRIINELFYVDEINKGELNYLLTNVCLRYLECNGISYSTFNDILGALEGCKLELYRRKVTPYEEKKIKDNGDL